MSCHQLQPSIFHLPFDIASLSLSASVSPRLVSSIVFYLKTRGTCDLRLGRLSGDAVKLDSGLVLNLSSSRNRNRKQQQNSRLTLSLSQLMGMPPLLLLLLPPLLLIFIRSVVAVVAVVVPVVVVV